MKSTLDIFELQMKRAKKGFRCVKGAIAFLNSLKGAILKKSLGHPGLNKQKKSFKLIPNTITKYFEYVLQHI